MVGIYKITNQLNNKVYIGQSINIKKRFNCHIWEAFNEKQIPYNYAINRAIRKYGIKNFELEVIEECKKEELDEKEKYWIKYYNSNNPNYGYNMTEGGDKGPSLKGELNPKARLREDDVLSIRQRLLKGEMPNQVYKDYINKISESAFYKVWRGETWKDILPEAISYVKTSEYIHNIRKYARKIRTEKESNRC